MLYAVSTDKEKRGVAANNEEVKIRIISHNGSGDCAVPNETDVWTFLQYSVEGL